MATFQDVRGIFESKALESLTTAGVASKFCFFDNVGETPGKSDETYAVVSMSFTDTVQDTVFCAGIEDLRGSLQCSVYTPRNEASVQGEEICLEVIKGWQDINRYRVQQLTKPALPSYRNSLIICPLAPYPLHASWSDSTATDQLGISLCDDESLLAGTAEYDNADIQPRLSIVHPPLLQRAAIRNIEGPITLAPDTRPHHVNVCSATWLARVA